MNIGLSSFKLHYFIYFYFKYDLFLKFTKEIKLFQSIQEL